ncbi:CRTAC1 family protein [Gilvimarinus agarilyticus]|uniref:CRTAC1 family protein n=1 Tax=Gilvimarinus sp. 2_MG-2023 TaxID=3062666 RepID=UPI001C088486|nr:CRTAC1 family protein [Gilvimarinus sp. 2_MG-2023]MBU2886380.1 CRTAC1 family protein [Gilvimarinus agarilyticus]MDO6571059.1 CRTAC1 family protein [Gilvimarinus sp. 2_MG-2023]
MKLISPQLAFCLIGASLVACQTQPKNPTEATTQAMGEFVFAQNLSHNDRNMRKWDAPVFADLDQDGWVDAVLNNHGYGIQVAWNDEGEFAEPWDLLMGDIHGVTVGDIDNDGLLELLLSRGGGSGSNARTARVFKAHKDRQFSEMREQDESLAGMRGRTLVLFDGDTDGDLDLLNFAFPDKNVKGSENYIYDNKPETGFSGSRTLARSYGDGQKTFVTDINNDGVSDLLMYGHKALRAFIGKDSLGFSVAQPNIFDQPIGNVTGIAQLDYDGDGDMDIYLSRGQEFESGQNFCSSDGSIWAGYGKRGRFDFGVILAGETISIKNYQSPWPNKKLWIGESAYEYEFTGETYSGADINLISSDSLGWPDKLEKNGLYAGYIGNEGWRLAGSSWSPLTVAVTNLSGCQAQPYKAGPQDILLENMGGRYQRASVEVIDNEPSHNMAVLASDLNNDGWQDLVVMPRGNLADPLTPQVLINKSGSGFKKISFPNLTMHEPGAIGMALGSADVNLDGKVDLMFGNERGKWSLFQNELQEADQHHYVLLDFGTEETGRVTWLDARVEVTACGRTQIARAGDTSASYSRSYNRYLHFGLGDCSTVDSVKVTRTNGDLAVIKDVNVDAINIVNF